MGRFASTVGAILVCVCTVSCAGAGIRAPETIAPQPELPALEELDELRNASGTAALDIFDYNTAVGVSATLDGLYFTAPADGLAYAIYGVDPPASLPLIKARVEGTGVLWILLADYGSGRWRQIAKLSEGSAEAHFELLVDSLSPAGFGYIALLAANGVDGQATALEFEYDGPANLHYVADESGGGDDTGPGTAESPWLTLQHAANTVGPDTLVVVRSGIYTGFELTHGGTEGAPIKFAGEPGAVINAPAQSGNNGIDISVVSGSVGYVEIEGFTIESQDVGIRLVGLTDDRLENVVVRNNTCIGSVNYGVFAIFCDTLLLEDNVCHQSEFGTAIFMNHDSDNVTLRGNTLYDSSYGIRITSETSLGGDGSIDNLLIDGNTIYGNTGWGVHCDGVDAGRFQNNLIYGNTDGLAITDAGFGGVTNSHFVNNTVLAEADASRCVYIEGSCTGNQFYNNIFINESVPLNFMALQIDASSLAGFVADHNVYSNGFVMPIGAGDFAVWQSETGQDANSVLATAATAFIDPAVPDLRPSGTSPARGVALESEAPPFDILGVPRPTGEGSECGCYEVP